MVTPSPATIIVATYNIRLGIQQGLESIVDVLLSAGIPDILALQEVGNHWKMGPKGDSTAQLSQLLGLPHHIHVATIKEKRSDGPSARYGHSLLSRWPIRSEEIIDLPQQIDEPRAILRCRIDAPFGAIDVISTHLSHLPSERPDQGSYLIRQLKKPKQPANPRFLLGDLNATADEDWLPLLLSNWIDADAEHQRPTFPAGEPRQRIDYILSQGAQLETCNVPETTEASDHRPIITSWLIGA